MLPLASCFIAAAMPVVVPSRPKAPAKSRWRWLRRIVIASVTGLILLFGLVVLSLELLLDRVPNTYHPLKNPIPSPDPHRFASLELDGFESPYLGHTGSFNGKGGAIFGGSKAADLDSEVDMGLRWTFLPVEWSAIEKEGPVDLSQPRCSQAAQLDDFLIAARQRKLNILLQIVIGGNAGGPPRWAGRREDGKSAPQNMSAAVEFARKLAFRYSPHGILSRREKWNDTFGVRAWELDNEPESYRTCWKNQPGDYAEFATRTAKAIHLVDSKAITIVAATAGGDHATPWLAAALDSSQFQGSPSYRAGGVHYSISDAADVVSFHCYEGLEVLFSSRNRSITDDLSDVRKVFAKSEPGRTREEFWHTEGDFDFLGILSAKRRAAWRFQFMTRAFAAGLRKVCVMDAKGQEKAAVKAYIAALPNPFPMKPADTQTKVLSGDATAFVHVDDSSPRAGRVWVIWPVAGAGDARVQIHATRDRVKVVTVDGSEREVNSAVTEHTITLDLPGDIKMARAVLVVDRPN